MPVEGGQDFLAPLRVAQRVWHTHTGETNAPAYSFTRISRKNGYVAQNRSDQFAVVGSRQRRTDASIQKNRRANDLSSIPSRRWRLS